MNFIHSNFLLQSASARTLYHDYAAMEPILDYHNHLPPQDIAENRTFNNLFEVWLEGDHYKWRAMRCNGEAERLCTGDASAKEKFLAWARTVPNTLRNPLYHWTHLELKRYFDIDTLLSEDTAEAIWEETSEQLSSTENRVHGLLKKMKVRALCTTDDPTDDLVHHTAIAESELDVGVYPTFRPDKAYGVDQPEQFTTWTEKLSAISNVDISSFDDFCEAIRARHDAFHALGSRLSDHGLPRCFASFCSASEAAAIFDRARAGQPASAEEYERFGGYMMVFFGHLDAEKGWTKQLHLGPLRNNNRKLFREIGGDIGCDSIGDFPQAEALSAYLSQLVEEDALPKMVLYNLNPNDNYIFATMAGNFMDGSEAGKIQFGSGWWFADQKEGMEWQMNALSNLGLFPRFIGMLTDSRSFMSFPRHEYFRRTMCNLLGTDMEQGILPPDMEMVGGMVRKICFQNAADFLKLSLPAG